MFMISMVLAFWGVLSAEGATACDENKITSNDVKVLQEENPVPRVAAAKGEESKEKPAPSKSKAKGSKATKAD